MKLEGAIFDLDGTLVDSMDIWNEVPKALVRRFGGTPPEDLARDIETMSLRDASEYLIRTFRLDCTTEQVMEGVNSLVTAQYRDTVPMKQGADRLLERLAVTDMSLAVMVQACAAALAFSSSAAE